MESGHGNKSAGPVRPVSVPCGIRDTLDEARFDRRTHVARPAGTVLTRHEEQRAPQSRAPAESFGAPRETTRLAHPWLAQPWVAYRAAHPAPRSTPAQRAAHLGARLRTATAHERRKGQTGRTHKGPATNESVAGPLCASSAGRNPRQLT